MPRIARIIRSRVAAITVAAATTISLPACRSVSSEGGEPSAAASGGEKNWALRPPQPTAHPPATNPVVALERSMPVSSGPIQQVQGKGPAGVTVPAAPAVVPAPKTLPPVAPAPSGPAPIAPIGPMPGGPAVQTLPPGSSPVYVGAAPGGEHGDRFWGASRGWSDAACGQPGCDNFDARPGWQNLPRMLGDQGRGAAGANVPTDLAGLAPEDLFIVRSAGSDTNAGTVSSHQFLAEVATPDGMTAFGATSGIRAQPNNDAQGLSPSLYVKRVLTSSENGMVGLGFGGTLPIGDDSKGNVFPWLFGARRITGDTWLQGLTGVNVPFTSSADLFGYADLGLVVPLAGRRTGPRGVKLYFTPELHANYLISRGDTGGPNFVLNSTIGFGARVRGFDIQVGMAFPLLSDRFYDYESIMRFTYRY